MLSHLSHWAVRYASPFPTIIHRLCVVNPSVEVVAHLTRTSLPRALKLGGFEVAVTPHLRHQCK